MVLFNQDLINHENGNMLLERKLFFGVVAEKLEEDDSYSVAYLILTSPADQPKKVNILMTHPDGKPILGGTAGLEVNDWKFSIRSISQLGVFPVLVEGVVIDNKLEITSAQFSATIQNKNRPIELD